MPYPQAGEVYAVEESLFNSTYQLDDRSKHHPTQKELISKWTPLLQNEPGSLCFESGDVFAKPVFEKRQESPNAIEENETHEIEVWVD